MGLPQTRKETETAEGWMTLGKAAAVLGLSRLAVATRIIAGELEGKHEAGMTFVGCASVEQLRAKLAAPKPRRLAKQPAGR